MSEQEKYAKLLELLNNDFTWPTDYIFKFIIPFSGDNLNKLKALFSTEAKIQHKESKSSKYISFTALQKFDGPQEIIEIYKKAEKIDKIVAL